MDDFYKTANRCFNSSKISHNNAEYFIACYLGGYVLECYGKLIFRKIYSTPPEDMKCYGHDVKKIKSEIRQLLADPSLSGLLNPLYIIDLANNCPTITRGSSRWDPIKRYTDAAIWDQAASQNYQQEIVILKSII